jgi:DHA1 family tetracycline resistance protein-like MFS transporter
VLVSSRSRLSFIFVTILLDAIGMGLLIPVLPDVLRRFSSDPSVVSSWFGWFIGVYSAMQFVASPVLGSLADRFGRRPVLLVSLLGAGLDYVLMAFAPNLGLLFAGRVVSGLTGASMTVASSYIADISDDSNRAANFGVVGAAWGLGFITGPAIGGLLGDWGASAPFLAAAALNLVNFAFGLFVLPESLPADERRPLDPGRLNPLASISRVLRPSPVLPLVLVYFLLWVGGNVHPCNWTLYTQARFHWTSREVGLSLSFVGLVIALVQGGLVKVAIERLGEKNALRLGTLVYVVGFALFGLATQGWMMYAILAFFGLSGLAMPALQGIVSRGVPANEQGELQGSLVSLGSLASIVAPTLYTPLFVHFTTPGNARFEGAAYVGASVVCLVALAVVLAWREERRA